ncbi:acyl-CoA dehydrogenase family protein [Actinokineospora pegani]|uniref:acyl-CoA dehydrogenase family protein n=1 Tax=Actinokineospora pegani TaxID=2654637 RepID=UPI0012EAD633|nr:acyl-CoA dehydrogenase family protein [Actinokineospora pegani]
MGDVDWVARARQVAARLAEDAVRREAKGAEPVAEIEELRSAGLLALTIPTGLGGQGQGWRTAFAVVGEIAAADASIGHLLGYHYLQLWRPWLFSAPERATELARRTAANDWFWAGVSNPRDQALILTDAPGGGFACDGVKFFATGASVADRLVVSALHPPTGRKLTFVLDAGAPGLRYLGDWDNLGQRLSASGGVEFTSVRVDPADLLDRADDPDDPEAPRGTLISLGFQLALTQVLAGLGRGALRTGAAYTREKARAWPTSGVDSAVEDTHTQAAYGTLSARLAAAELLVDRAVVAFADADALGVGLDPVRRGELGVLVSQAKVLVSELAVEISSRVFEVTGARATAARVGLDRFWRNARTLTLHDPTVYKAAEVGRHVLTGALPRPDGYS